MLLTVDYDTGVGDHISVPGVASGTIVTLIRDHQDDLAAVVMFLDAPVNGQSLVVFSQFSRPGISITRSSGPH